MKPRSFTVAITVACIAAQGMLAPAAAEEAKKHHYYFKRGASPARWDADVAACLASIQKSYIEPAKRKLNSMYQPGIIGGAVSGFARGMEKGRMIREAAGLMSKCMLNKKGYRRVAMNKRQLDVWNQLDREQRKQAERILAGGGNIAPLLSN